jgi:nicotinate dehydrogenase subunit B
MNTLATAPQTAFAVSAKPLSPEGCRVRHEGTEMRIISEEVLEMDSDRIKELDFTDNPRDFSITRRGFLQGVGGGIIILFLGSDALAQRGGHALPADFNAFLRIAEDGRVTCFTGKIEMGQGIITSFAQMLADELDVALESVDMVMGDTDLCPWDGGTHGSMSTRFFGPPLRAAGAQARAVLLELASQQLKRPIDQLVTENGVVFDKTEKTLRVTYGELAKGKQIIREVKSAAAVKKPAAMKVIGKPATRRDALEKVTGKAKFAADFRPAGMLYAKILRAPAHGATLTSVDTSAAEKIKGVQVVRDGDLVAVLHEHPDVAEKALSEIKAEWSKSEATVDDVTIFDHLLKVAGEGQDVSRGGDLKAGEARATSVFDSTYLNSYVAHAPMEPHTAVAQIQGKKTTIWASTQSPFGARDEAAKALDCPPEDVRVITPFVGGGFGGKGRNLQVVEAARLAKLAGKPVAVAWTREEEFFDDSFRPAAIVKIRSGVTGSDIAFWDYQVYFAGTRGSEHFYNITDYATVSHGSGWGSAPGTHPFATGAWRAPGNNTNTFARESQIDIMAAKAGIDPVEFRLKNLRDEKMRGVLTAAAKQFGWTAAKPPHGRGYGVALGIDSGTYVATIAEVEVDEKTGAIAVKRVVCAQDMGLCINPEGAKLMIEGCITMGLGYALTEEIHFKGGDILDLNFDTYQIPRFSWLPKIETLIVGDQTAPAQGGGEPSIITMGAVLANAVYSATGARLFQLPMTPERVLAALKSRGH